MKKLNSLLLQLILGFTYYISFIICKKVVYPTIKQGDVSVTLMNNHTTVNINSPSGRYSVIYAVHYQNPEVALAYLDYNEFGGSGRYKGNFLPFNAPPEVTVTHKTYTKSGYDRGHLISNDLFNFNSELSKETFAVYNICPQLPNFNQGKKGYKAWRDLENATEKAYANAYGRIYVITGPVFDQEPAHYNTLPNSKCVIPEKFFKIILVQDLKDETYEFNKMEAYIFEHRDPKEGEVITLSDCKIVDTNDVEGQLKVIEEKLKLKINLLADVPEPYTVDEPTTVVEEPSAAVEEPTTEPSVVVDPDTTNIVEPVPTEEPATVSCKAEAYGYKCCSHCIVKTEEDDILWGVEDGDWCGITDECINKSNSNACKAEAFGYKCCSHCVVETEEDGIVWGIENDEWCGITDDCIAKSSNYSCKAEAYGYKCCSGCTTVSEEDGILYGTENGEWCGITDECIKSYDECWSEKLGYPCCDSCEEKYTDDSGSWGIMNSNWCGIPTSCSA